MLSGSLRSVREAVLRCPPCRRASRLKKQSSSGPTRDPGPPRTTGPQHRQHSHQGKKYAGVQAFINVILAARYVISRNNVIASITVSAPPVGRLSLCTTCGSFSWPAPLANPSPLSLRPKGTRFSQEEHSPSLQGKAAPCL